MLGIHITIQRDIVMNLIVPMCAGHNFIPLPPFPPVPPPLPSTNPWAGPAMAIETIVNAWWPPGYALGSNKFTTTVFHQGMGVVQDGHDCGKFIPHVQVAPAPNNLLTLIHIPLSKRKCQFSASTVKMNKKAVATMSWPITPMKFCAEPISNPAGAMAITPIFVNTVKAGMSLVDFLVGLAVIALEALIEYAFYRAGGGTTGFGQSAGRTIAASQVGRTTAQLVVPKLFSTGLDNLGKWALKQLAGSFVNSTRAALTGSGTVGVTVTVGTPFFNVSGTAGYDVGRGEGTASATARAATLTGTVNSDGASVGNNTFTGSETHNLSDGSSSSTDVSPTEGFRNQTTTTNSDGTTSVVDSGGRQSAPGDPL